MRAAKHLVLALTAILALSGVMSGSAYAKNRKPHHGKYSHYKLGNNADALGKYKAPKKQKVAKHSYKAH